MCTSAQAISTDSFKDARRGGLLRKTAFNHQLIIEYESMGAIEVALLGLLQSAAPRSADDLTQCGLVLGWPVPLSRRISGFQGHH